MNSNYLGKDTLNSLASGSTMRPSEITSIFESWLKFRVMLLGKPYSKSGAVFDTDVKSGTNVETNML